MEVCVYYRKTQGVTTTDNLIQTSVATDGKPLLALSTVKSAVIVPAIRSMTLTTPVLDLTRLLLARYTATQQHRSTKVVNPL